MTIPKAQAPLVATGLSSKLTETLARAVGAALRPVLAELTKRIEALEAAPRGLSYRGVYDENATYRRGECVTRDGSIWHCELDNSRGLPPGANNAAWRLAVKHGRDGKDLRR